MNPHNDWREAAEYSKSLPKCKNCGLDFGNVYFGAQHTCFKKDNGVIEKIDTYYEPAI